MQQTQQQGQPAIPQVIITAANTVSRASVAVSRPDTSERNDQPPDGRHRDREHRTEWLTPPGRHYLGMVTAPGQHRLTAPPAGP